MTVRFMCPGLDKNNDDLAEELVDKNYIREKINRPVLESLPDVKGAHELLWGPIFKHYGTKPTSGKIVTLGKL